MLLLLLRSNGEDEEKSFFAEALSKCGLHTSGISNTWKLVRRATSGAPLSQTLWGGVSRLFFVVILFWGFSFVGV